MPRGQQPETVVVVCEIVVVVWTTVVVVCTIVVDVVVPWLSVVVVSSGIATPWVILAVHPLVVVVGWFTGGLVPPVVAGGAVGGGGGGAAVVVVTAAGSSVTVKVSDVDWPDVLVAVTVTRFGPGWSGIVSAHVWVADTLTDTPADEMVVPGVPAPTTVRKGVATWEPSTGDTMLNGTAESAVVLVGLPSPGTEDVGVVRTSPTRFGCCTMRTPNSAATRTMPARPMR
jgi:hypothetical protein